MEEFDNEMIDELLHSMTLKEKIGQLNQQIYGWKAIRKTGERSYELTQEFKDYIDEYGGVGSIYGVLRADPWSGMNEQNGVLKEDSIKVINMIQDYINKHTRLKIPALITEECVHGHQGMHSMMYPSNISMGMTWNPKLLENVCREISNELASKGGNIALYTGLDVMRDPRWGRTEECYSEDPYLTSVMVQHAVDGLQNFDNGIGILLKHFCAQGAASGGHNSGAASIGERELREIYLPPAKKGVKAIGIMAAYNEIDGIPCHINKRLLNGVLRNEYGFNGIIMADGCALDRLLLLEPDHAKVAAMANNAGIDISLWDSIYPHLEEAIAKGYLEKQVLEKSVSRVLELKFKLGLLKKEENIEPMKYEDKSKEMALQSARECQVLLKNNGILPLSKNIKSIAVIGPNANNKYNMLGDYTSFQKAEDVVTIYEGIKNICGSEIEVNYALGCKIRDTSTEYIAEAIELAKKSDVVILALGGSSTRNFNTKFESNGAVKSNYNKDEMNCGENVDKACLNLDGLQEELFNKVHEVNPNIITILIQGRPHTIEKIIHNNAAIIAAWYPGNLGGLAIAETIFGINNPSGHLSMTIGKSSMQIPYYYNGKNSGAKEDYCDMTGKPIYPFGYGLSYTSFLYDKIELSHEEITREELEINGIDVSLEITNKGNYDGMDVVQIYIVDKEASVTRRMKELKSFSKIFVRKGESKQISLHLDGDAFKIWNSEMKYVIEPGNVDILVAYDSSNYIKKTILIN